MRSSCSIVRPYLQAVSGTPESWAFDRDKRVLDFTYAPKRASGSGSFPAGSETQISVPLRQYGTGYAVALRGGAVTSKAGDQLLRVLACTGADRVMVKVQPGSGTTSSCAAPPAKGAAKTQLRMTLSPPKVAAGRLVTMRVMVRANGEAVRAARGCASAEVRARA